MLRPSLALGALLAMASAACGGDAGEAPPRAVVVVIDTLRHDALGSGGAGGDPTPRLDALAAEGSRFEQAISSSGWTLPAVASLLTGTWPSVHKAVGKKTRIAPISDDLPTVAEVLRDAGFATGAIANAAFLSPYQKLDRGFDVFDHAWATNSELRGARASVDAALAFASEHQGEPLFLLVHLFDPHLDYAPGEEAARRFAGPEREPALPIDHVKVRSMLRAEGRRPPSEADVAYVRGAYQAEVSEVDAAVGRLLDGLRGMGMYEESAIVVTADHGEEFWEHRGFEHGHSLYDELVRVPLIVKLPASAGPPAEPVVEAQVRVLDVMPTLLDLYEVEAPATFAGESLLPLMRGEGGAGRLAFAESTLYGPERLALRGERYKYLVDRDPPAGSEPREELYDWRTDPGETRDLATSHPELLAEMRTEMARFRAELEFAATTTRPGEPRDMRPDEIDEFGAMIEALGYSGRDEDEE